MRVLALVGLLALGAGLGVARGDAPYRDPEARVDVRVADLLGRMTLEEKIGQMTQIDLARLMGSGPWDRGPLNEAWLDRVLGGVGVGSLLSGGGAAPVPSGPAGWADTIDTLQRHALESSRLAIPILYGADAVHGHNNVQGATVYPHQVGLAAAFDEDLVADVGRAVGEDVAATGVSWNFAPVADLGRDPRWGRFYETFGENPAVAGALTAAYVRGQTDVPRLAVTLKHFVGYGHASDGNDRGPADIPLRTLRERHLPPFAAGLRAGAPTVMINSGSVNGVPVHASRFLLTDVLRDELGFTGVALSDWADVEKLVTVHGVAADAVDAVALAVNAGVDVVMVPHDAEGFAASLREAVASGAVAEARIDEAAGRVLALKFALGLFETPYVGTEAAASVLAGDRSLARRAARDGLTLLSNRARALPLTNPSRVLVTGPGATDVAMQMGGWTIGWQGIPAGATPPPAVTVLEGLRQEAPAGTEVTYRAPGAADLADAARAADAVIVVLGEAPYAETAGDSDDPRLDAVQVDLVRELHEATRESGADLITVLLAGRPLFLPDDLRRASDALLMAYLPGSEGGAAIAEVLYGAASPAGRLPFTWPASVGQAGIAGDAPPSEARGEPLHPLGHGLSYSEFRYADASVERVASELRLRVTVSNVGDVAAGEVVLAYADFPLLPRLAPERALVGFARTSDLEPGESERVEIAVPLGRLALVPGDVDAAHAPAVLPGEYGFEMGGAGTRLALPACDVTSGGASVDCP